MAVDALESALGYFDHLPSGSLIIIKDTLHASGSFLVHHFINRLLANKSGGHRSGLPHQVQSSSSDVNVKADGPASVCKVCLIGCNNTNSHFVSVGRKLGGNLVSAAEEGKLRFIDGVSTPFVFEDGRNAGSNAESRASSLYVQHHTPSQGESQGRSRGAVQGNSGDGSGEVLRDSLAKLSPSSPSDLLVDVKSRASNGSAALPAPAVPSESSRLLSKRPEEALPFAPMPDSPYSTPASSKQTQLLGPKPLKQSTSSEASKARTWTCPIPSLPVCNMPSPLLSLYKQIATAIGDDTGQGRSRQTLDSGLAIVFDDLGGVEAACQGVMKDVLALLNQCRRLWASNGERASVVALVHDDHVVEGEKGLAAMLEHAADLVLQVEPLSTGAAADIHGQLTVMHRTDRWRLGLSSETTGRSAGFPAEQRFQFRLLETGVKLIHIGSGKGGA